MAAEHRSPALTPGQGKIPLPAVFLMGPTASGKTDIAAALTADFDIDLISVDAAQVYRSMNIGTAKPDPQFLERFPHQLIDIRSPQQTYSAADFVHDARQAIRRSHDAGRVPLLVGGTLFYFNALERGLSALPAADATLRAQIEIELETHGVQQLHKQLLQLDPATAARIDHNDRQRVQRALEIYRLTGDLPSRAMTGKQPLECPLVKLTLFTADRAQLHQRIAQRFQIMLEQGLVDEVRQIIRLDPDVTGCPSMRTVGYRQVIEFIEEQVSYPQMVDNSVAATRQLAKRQLTWLRQQAGIIWCQAGRSDTLDAIRILMHDYLTMMKK